MNLFPSWTPDTIAALRHRLGLTQLEFAERYFIPLRIFQNWEQGRSEPDPAANTLLHLIDFNPDHAADALAWVAQRLDSKEPQAASQQVGQWVRCTPDLINAGVSCAHTPRRAGDGTYSHDHWISHAPQAATTAIDRYMESSIALDSATDNFYGQAATTASAGTLQEQFDRRADEQYRRAQAPRGPSDLPDDWKTRMVKYGETEDVALRAEIDELRAALARARQAATTASADQARDLLRTLINERYESQAQAARTWHMLPQVLNDMLQGRRALSDFVLAKLGLRPVVMYEKDE